MGYIKLFTNTVDYQDYINDDPLLPNVSLVEEDDIVYYNPFVVDYSKEYMYVEALEDGLTVSLKSMNNYGGLTTAYNTLYYSTDKTTWKTLSPEDKSTEPINAGEKIYLKGNCVVPENKTGIGIFYVSKNYNVTGNVMSLLFGDDFVDKTDLSGYNYAFYDLFRNCTTIQSAKNLILPATTLANSCYGYIFQGCSSLTSAPELPATTLAEGCYQSMFSSCTSLTTAPELPATTLAYRCYYYMFSQCKSLTTAPELPATTLADACYGYMFNGCTGLTTAPELPATTLADACYSNMFWYCTNLNYIKMLASDISATNCLASWVSDVASTGTFVKADGVEIPTGTSGIPEGWTVQTA